MPASKRLQVITEISQSMELQIAQRSRSSGATPNAVAADLLRLGIALFDEQTNQQSPSEVLQRLRDAIPHHDKSLSLTIETDRKLVMKTRLRAGVMALPAEEFAKLMMMNGMSAE